MFIIKNIGLLPQLYQREQIPGSTAILGIKSTDLADESVMASRASRNMSQVHEIDMEESSVEESKADLQVKLLAETTYKAYSDKGG